MNIRSKVKVRVRVGDREAGMSYAPLSNAPLVCFAVIIPKSVFFRPPGLDVSDVMSHYVMTYKLLELGHDAQNRSVTSTRRVRFDNWTSSCVVVDVHPYDATQLDVTALSRLQRLWHALLLGIKFG